MNTSPEVEKMRYEAFVKEYVLNRAKTHVGLLSGKEAADEAHVAWTTITKNIKNYETE